MVHDSTNLPFILQLTEDHKRSQNGQIQSMKVINGGQSGDSHKDNGDLFVTVLSLMSYTLSTYFLI